MCKTKGPTAAFLWIIMYLSSTACPVPFQNIYRLCFHNNLWQQVSELNYVLWRKSILFCLFKPADLFTSQLYNLFVLFCCLCYKNGKSHYDGGSYLHSDGVVSFLLLLLTVSFKSQYIFCYKFSHLGLWLVSSSKSHSCCYLNNVLISTFILPFSSLIAALQLKLLLLPFNSFSSISALLSVSH